MIVLGVAKKTLLAGNIVTYDDIQTYGVVTVAVSTELEDNFNYEAELEEDTKVTNVEGLKDIPEKGKVYGIELVIKQIYEREFVESEYSDFRQNIILTDGSKDVRVSLWDCNPIGSELKGKLIKISEASKKSYKNEPQLSVGKSATISVATPEEAIKEKEEKPQPKATKADYLDIQKQAFIDAANLLTSKEITAVLEKVISCGWSSEDVRSLAIGIAINKTRNG